MMDERIIDALYGIPRNSPVAQIGDCTPFMQDLAPLMSSSGICGAVLAPRSCANCQHHWNCADRRTDEVIGVVRHNRGLVHGLASYDSLRIGESLRWIEESITRRGLSGAYAPAECCVSGLDASRMYPLYGLCAMLHTPVLLDFLNREGWSHHRPEVEVVAADFPDLEIVLAPPPGTDPSSIASLMQRFHRISVVLSPQELQMESSLRNYAEQHGREHILFCSSSKGWQTSVELALTVPLTPSTRRAYLYENAARLFGFAEGASEAIA